MNRTALVVLVTLLALSGAQASGANPIGSGNDASSANHIDSDLPVVIDAGSVSGVSADGSKLLIDASTGTARGVPVNARVSFGNPADPIANPAFTLTNTVRTNPVHLSVSYTVSSGDGVGDGESNVEFRFYDADGNEIAAEDEEPGATDITIPGGDTAYVVVVIDTTVGDLSPSSDLSGSVTVTGS